MENRGRGGVGRRGGEKVTKFFIGNLPERCSSRDLEDFFKDMGEIVWIYIARRRDSKGCRFGFISFINVKDIRELEKNMHNTKMGDKRLKVNVAKFTSTGGEQPHPPMDYRNNQQLPERQKSERNSFVANQQGGMSWKDTLMKDQRQNVQEEIIEVSQFVQAFKDRYGRALVGRVIDLVTLRTLDCLASKAGVVGMEIQYIGGFYVLITFSSEEEAREFLEVTRANHPWFSSLDVWMGQPLPYERIAWLNIHGVPLHLSDNEVYDSIGRRFGKVIHASQLQQDDRNLSFDCVGIIVGDGKLIYEEVTLVWDKKRFKVWVVEETGDWIPDCISKDGEDCSMVDTKRSSDWIDGLFSEPRNCQPEIGVQAVDIEKSGPYSFSGEGPLESQRVPEDKSFNSSGINLSIPKRRGHMR
ncbi:putative RNA recognition motif domain, nucleotide-binding alpha-beta plait domain superfamily [Helianthus annuus]|nr:putative RNA recognition motif domain, nucleotide-binding alpha-beta plait domain superfamily [Helianthus annuus]